MNTKSTLTSINGSSHLQLNSLQKQLLNDFQKDLPLSPTPYADIAVQLGVTEAEVLEILQELQQHQLIGRVGPVFQPHRIGTSTLAAMSVPKERLQSVADYISALPEVNHNYEREHHINLWFVITATGEVHLQIVLSEIEQNTGIKVMSLPILENYHLDFSFALKWCNE
jgi:DNA-binding Lrp family transcriptional regulator